MSTGYYTEINKNVQEDEEGFVLVCDNKTVGNTVVCQSNVLREESAQ